MLSNPCVWMRSSRLERLHSGMRANADILMIESPQSFRRRHSGGLRTGLVARAGNVYYRGFSPLNRSEVSVKPVAIQLISYRLQPLTYCYETKFRLSPILVAPVVIVCKITSLIISIASKGTYETVHQRANPTVK